VGTRMTRYLLTAAFMSMLMIRMLPIEKPMLNVECGASHRRLPVDSFIKQCNRKNNKKQQQLLVYIVIVIG